MVCAWIIVCAVPENSLPAIGSPSMRSPLRIPRHMVAQAPRGCTARRGALSDAPPVADALVSRGGYRAG